MLQQLTGTRDYGLHSMDGPTCLHFTVTSRHQYFVFTVPEIVKKTTVLYLETTFFLYLLLFYLLNLSAAIPKKTPTIEQTAMNAGPANNWYSKPSPLQFHSQNGLPSSWSNNSHLLKINSIVSEYLHGLYVNKL